ncbi:Protein of uncharacterised function (DUF2491) [Klebsiella pneumoniae]|uniref:Protein of uncharacterized function (DUF2491) n=1 Tax=Klebsiella pneumoniae TaxID=573 RepID=A0A4P0XK04_KLEPN|nr:Protein of uncharacterised function (DUF2491) [Klebsiella pneumoniae]
MYWHVCVNNRANDCGPTVSSVLMGESLRSGHGPFFSASFAKKSTPTPVRGPLGLHLKAGFTLDTLAFRLLEDNLLIELPGEAYTIAATGQIDLGGGSRIYRYYTSGDEFLQINTTGGADVDDIDDIKLFVYVQSDGISQEKYWRSAISPASIGTPTFSWRQQRWQRFFNGGEPGNIAPSLYAGESRKSAACRMGGS